MLWFNKKAQSKHNEDKIYMSNKSKLDAVAIDLKSRPSRSPVLFVSYFFNKTKEELVKILDEQQVKYSAVENEFAGGINITDEAAIYLIKAKTLDKVFNFKNYATKTESHICDFLFAEHYPTYSKEESVLNKIDELTGCKAVILFYASLDEPLFKFFGGDNIKNMMIKLGIKEDECIQHSMVTKSIENAQKKIEKKISSDFETPSQDDWFLKNYPQY